MLNTVLMFPGQASQYVGMGKEWYEKYEVVRRKFEQASDILHQDMKKLCFEGPTSQLVLTENTQIALVTTSVAMFDVIVNELGIVPSYLAGHSIGEISALTAAGVLSFEDAIRLAKIRGEAMAACDKDGKAGMVAVTKIHIDELQKILQEIGYQDYSVDIANYNAPMQTILSGDNEGLKKIGELLEPYNARVIPLNVAGPFHSRYMEPAKEKVASALESMTLRNMNIPVICGHKGRLYNASDNIKDMIVEQLTSSIRWTQVVDVLQNLGVERWIEVGPNEVLKKLVQQSLPEAYVFAYDEKDKNNVSSNDKVQNNEKKLNPIGLCLGAAVSTRNTNWNEEEYEQGVVKPYHEIRDLYKKIETEKRKPSLEEMESSLNKLQMIFNTKGVPVNEQAMKYQKILKNVEFEELRVKFLEDRK